MSKIMQVYYDNAGYPFKDSDLSIRYPIVEGGEFTGANNTTEVHFYTENMGQATWVANCKLPDGTLVNRLLVSATDSDGLTYQNLPLDSELTSVKGHLKIGLNGYSGNISVDEETLDDSTLIVISGTPSIIATGIIDIAMNYSPIVIPVSDLTTTEYQQLLSLIGDKLDISSGILVATDISLLSATSYNEGQVIYDKRTQRIYKVTSGAFVEEANFVYVDKTQSITGEKTFSGGIYKTNSSYPINEIVSYGDLGITPDTDDNSHIYVDSKDYIFGQDGTTSVYKGGYDSDHELLNKEEVVALIGDTPEMAGYVKDEVVDLDETYPSTSTNGVVTSEQLATLLGNKYARIHFNSEYYILQDMNSDEGWATYTNQDYNNSQFELKVITITINTLAWVLNKGVMVDEDYITTNYYNKTYIDSEVQTLTELASGKTKTLTLRYNVVAITSDNFSVYDYFKQDGTSFEDFADFLDYVGASSESDLVLLNTLLYSEDDTINLYSSLTSGSYFLQDYSSGRIVLNSDYIKENYKDGDILLVININVPDRWFQKDALSGDLYLNKLETTKVNLSNYVDLTSTQTISGVKTFSGGLATDTIKDSGSSTRLTLSTSGYVYFNANTLPSSTNTRDLGSSTYAWKDLYLSGVAYVGDLLPITGTDLTIGNSSGVINVRSTLRPYADNSRNLGTSSLRWATTFTSNLNNGTYTLSVGDIHTTLFNRYVADNTITELPYTTLSVISVSANTTFTLATAPASCYPEYKGEISNNGESDITLTFTGVTNILCNDDNITISSNTLTLPSGSTIEYSIINGNMVAINFEAN